MERTPRIGFLAAGGDSCCFRAGLGGLGPPCQGVAGRPLGPPGEILPSKPPPQAPTTAIKGACIWNCPPKSQLHLDKDVILRDHFNLDRSWGA